MLKEKVLKSFFTAIGCMLFCIGMAMCLVEEWNIQTPGTILGLIGICILLILKYYTSIREKSNKDYKLNIKLLVAILIGLDGVLCIFMAIIRLISNNASLSNWVYWVILTLGIVITISNFIIFYIFRKKKIEFKLKRENTYSTWNLILIFFIYGFLGWCMEFLLCGVVDSMFVNRGFLHITMLPIYGFGGIIITLMYNRNDKYIFIRGTLIAAILEYSTSFVLEKLFNKRWWDYTEMPLNLNGRICLLYSLLFGFAGTLIAKFISPYINSKLGKVNINLKKGICVVLCVIFAVDVFISVIIPNTGEGITTYVLQTTKLLDIV